MSSSRTSTSCLNPTWFGNVIYLWRPHANFFLCQVYICAQIAVFHELKWCQRNCVNLKWLLTTIDNFVFSLHLSKWSSDEHKEIEFLGNTSPFLHLHKLCHKPWVGIEVLNVLCMSWKKRVSCLPYKVPPIDVMALLYCLWNKRVTSPIA